MPRAQHEFCINIPKFNGCKKDIQLFIDNVYAEQSEKYCISLDGESANIYLKTIPESEISADSIVADFTAFTETVCEVRSCRSSKTWLLNICKVDKAPISKNVAMRDLALHSRAHSHTTSPSAVVMCTSSNASATQQPSVDELFSSIPFAEDVGWTRNLLEWFASGYKRTHRYAAYVFGKGGEGKTRIVRMLAKGKNVFECRLTEPYAFDGFDSSTDILLLEDVNWECFDITLRSTLLSIMAQQPAVIQRKYKPQTVVANDKVLTIFTSNFKLPSDTAFRRRTYIVWAKVKACKDTVADSGADDPGDDDTHYVNPKLAVTSCHNMYLSKVVNH